MLSHPLPLQQCTSNDRKLDKWNNNKKEVTKVGTTIPNSNIQARRHTMDVAALTPLLRSPTANAVEV